MRTFSKTLAVTSLLLAVTFFSSRMAVAQEDAPKPLLSEEIKQVLDADGAEAAQRRFDEIFPEHKDEYEIDLQGITELGGVYMQRGDQQAAMLFLQIIGDITNEMAASYEFPEMDETAIADGFDRELMEEEAPVEASVYDPGLPRADLERFHGFYATPELADKRRMLFVSESCDGYLVAGAVWGDAQNWWMRSEGDHSFVHANSYPDLEMDFEVDSDGNATAMTHNLDFMPSPLPKHEPLPEDWKECIPPVGG